MNNSYWVSTGNPKGASGLGVFHGVRSPLSWERTHRFLSYPQLDHVDQTEQKAPLVVLQSCSYLVENKSLQNHNFLKKTLVCSIHICWGISKFPFKDFSLLSSKWTQIPCLYVGVLCDPCSNMHLWFLPRLDHAETSSHKERFLEQRGPLAEADETYYCIQRALTYWGHIQEASWCPIYVNFKS